MAEVALTLSILWRKFKDAKGKGKSVDGDDDDLDLDAVHS
jgi:hypothetical protein